MKLPLDSQISPEKLTDYLLVFNKKSDKSNFLAKGGYTLANWQTLEEDIRNLLSETAVFQKSDIFGEYFAIVGQLNGGLLVKTIWLREVGQDAFRFITLVPQSKQEEQ